MSAIVKTVVIVMAFVAWTLAMLCAGAWLGFEAHDRIEPPRQVRECKCPQGHRPIGEPIGQPESEKE